MFYRTLKIFISFVLTCIIIRYLINPNSPTMSVSGLLSFLDSAPNISIPYVSLNTFQTPVLNDCMAGWQPIINFAVHIINISVFIVNSAINLVTNISYFFGYIFVV